MGNAGVEEELDSFVDISEDCCNQVRCCTVIDRMQRVSRVVSILHEAVGYGITISDMAADTVAGFDPVIRHIACACNFDCRADHATASVSYCRTATLTA